MTIQLRSSSQTAGQLNHIPLLIVLLGWLAGLRLSEMLALQWKNVKFDSNVIVVDASDWWGVGGRYQGDA